jgi:beta-lactam-binding protein with PASTA domain
MVPMTISSQFDSIRGWLRRLATVTVVLALFGAVVALQACAPAKLTHVLVNEREAEPSEYGRVVIMRKDKPMETRLGMDLQPNSIVETDERSWAVLQFTSGAKVILKPNTRVQIASLTVIFGEILAVIEKIRGAFAVKQEDVVAAPKSTIFSVRRSVDGPTVVGVIHGAVELTSPTRSWPAAVVKQYQRAVIRPGSRPVIDTLEKGRFNTIVGWANRVEMTVNPAEARVIVPHLRQLDKAKALAIIKSAGLGVGRITPRITDSRPPVGTVIEQRPAPGARVAKGTLVDIGVEAEPVETPQLINQRFSVAKQLLLKSGLTLGRISRRITGKAPAETVIDQTPLRGKVIPKASAVDIVVEEESVVVPNVLRMNRDKASAALANNRLVVESWEEEITGTQPAHTVLRQHPSSNQRVRPGSGVKLVVEAVSVVVPNVVGQHRHQALALLGQAQLVQGGISEQITGSRAAGVVLHQTPPPGQRVLPGTQVHLQVEAVSVVVPNIVGMMHGTAGQTLGGVNLVFGGISEELRENVNNGVILRQTPPPGQRVALRTPISVTIAKRGIRVPNLTGRTRNSAAGALQQYYLSLGSVTQRVTTGIPVGNIMDQNPRPGMLVPAGSRVNIVVATRPPCYVPTIVQSPLPPPTQMLHPTKADQIIRAAGLVPRNRGGNYGSGARVNYQYPRPGFKLFCGDTVEYTTIWVLQ